MQNFPKPDTDTTDKARRHGKNSVSLPNSVFIQISPQPEVSFFTHLLLLYVFCLQL